MRILFLLLISFSSYGQAYLFLGLNRQREAQGSVPADQTVTVLVDDASGPGSEKITYTGTWGVGWAKSTFYQGTQSVSTTTNSYYEYTDNFTAIEIWTEKFPSHGIAAVSIDGGAETTYDAYAAAEEDVQLMWSSGTLTPGIHTLRVRVTGTANAGNTSGDEYVVLDFLKVTKPADAPVDPGDDDANWWVDQSVSSSGNGLTLATAFKTIDEAANVAAPGDVVVIKAGTYRETITTNNSGTSGNPIVFRGATGETVIISGLNTLSTSWSSYSGNIYRTAASLPRTGHNTSTSLTALNSNTYLMANQIFHDGNMKFEASTRAINTVDDLFDKTKWKALTVANFPATSATDALWSGKSLTGATAVIQGWFASGSRTVTSQSGNTANFSAYSDNSSLGNQYRRWVYFSNDLDLLDAAQEWHYDGTYLYYWQTGGGSPTGTFEYKVRNWGFDLRDRSYITIEDLTFKGCEPVTGNDNTNFVTVDNIRATYTNHNVRHDSKRWQEVGMTMQMGLKLTGNGCILRNSEISYTSDQAVWIGRNGRVENNKIHHIGYDGGWAAGVDIWGEGTAATPIDNVVITRNRISYTSRSSVSLGYGFEEFFHRQFRNMEISYNDFSQFCLFSDDGGAIYTWGYRDHTGSRVHHNWFHDSGFKNNPLNLPASGRLDGIQVGFYTDQGAGPFTVDHNVFWNISENFTGDAADVYTQPTFSGGAGGFRNNGGSKFYNNTWDSDSPWTGKSNPNNSPPEVFTNNIFKKDWNFFPSSTIVLTGTTNIYNSSPAPLFNGGSLATPEIYFGLQSGSPAVNRGTAITGITDGSIGNPDSGAYERGVTPWVPGPDW